MPAKFTAAKTEFTSCECCNMTEEYTSKYVKSVRNLFVGKFVCGLCSEAVKYEFYQRKIGVDDSLPMHMRFLGEFVVSSPSSRVELISAIREMFKRRLVLPLPSYMDDTNLVASSGHLETPKQEVEHFTLRKKMVKWFSLRVGKKVKVISHKGKKLLKRVRKPISTLRSKCLCTI